MNDKPTIRQQLKLLRQQHASALDEIRSKDQLIAVLQGQLGIRDNHIASLKSIADGLDSELTACHSLIDELRSREAILLETASRHSEKISVQDQIIQGQQRTIESQLDQLTRQAKLLEKMDGLRHGKRMAARMLFGRKSEKIHQPAIVPDVFGEDVSDEELAQAKEVFYKTGFARIEKEPIPGLMEQGLPVKTTVIKLDVVPDGVRLIGTKTSRRLVYHKAWSEIHETIRYIYMREDRDNLSFKNITEKLPVRPLKCKADTSLCVQLAIDRYLYHTPVKRSQAKFAQAGVRLPYSTLLDWSNNTAKLLAPLHALQLRELVKGGLLHCDETGLTVLDKSKKAGKKSHRGQVLALMNPLQGIVAFKYMKGRGLDEIGQVLRGFKGYLHTDGYTGYNHFGSQPGVLHGRCLAHTRRYFFNAKDDDEKRAFYVLKHFINPLYAIERKCRADGLDFDQITAMRQRYAVPIFNAFHAWLLRHQPRVKKHSPMARAIEYTLRLWKGIILYCSDGMLQPDNNCIEREIRPIALGKKNFMFAGSHEAAPNAAIMYSFFSTCRLQGIDPETWLTDVLGRIAVTPKDKLADLLPQHWKHRRLAA